VANNSSRTSPLLAGGSTCTCTTATLENVARALKLEQQKGLLSDDEIRIIWPVLGEAGTFGALVKALMLTAQRRDEIAQMSRKQIDEDAIWEIPAERYKTMRPNFIPLSKAAVALIDAQPKIDDCDYVFPLRAKTPFSGFGKGKATLDRAVFAAIKRHAKKGVKVESLPNWTLHDLRPQIP
jgi:integrase